MTPPYSTLFCESMREAILPSMISWASSFSKASTGVLNADAISVMSTETKGEKYCTIGGGGGEEVEEVGGGGWRVVAVSWWRRVTCTIAFDRMSAYSCSTWSWRWRSTRRSGLSRSR